MKKHKSKLHRLGRQQYFAPLLFVSGFVVVGSLLLLVSFAAAPDDPIGFADSCSLDGTTTVVRGWAHDDSAGSGPSPTVQVTVAGQTVTAPTSIANYRQAEIDAALTSQGYTPATIYGFEARFTGLYRGTNPVISGTIFNIGPGANQPLGINTFNQGAASSSSAIFQNGNIVPDSCLASRPSPAPTPTPTTPKPKSTSTVKKPTTSPTPASPTPTPVAAQPQTSYVVTLNFVNNSAAVADVKAALVELNSTATTGQNNQIIFHDVPPGIYTVNLSHLGKDYSYTLEVPGQSTASADGKTLSYTIDLARLSVPVEPQQITSAPRPAKTSGHMGKLVVLFAGFIFIILMAIIFVRRRRSRRNRNSNHDDVLTRSYEQPIVTPTYPHTPTTPHDPTLHTGVSLKQMVIESMREEAAKREHNDPPKQ